MPYNETMSLFNAFCRKINTAAHRGLKQNCEVAANQARRFLYKKFGLCKKYIMPQYEWDENLEVFNGTKCPRLDFAGKIAVQAHLFYPELAQEICQNINLIPCDFDLYVSTDTEQKASLIQETMKRNCRAKNVLVQVFENRGRDVLPFLQQLRPVIKNYDLFCHIHSKRTPTDENFKFGESWRRYLLRHLFGTKSNVCRILNIFEHEEKRALVFPETYPVVSIGVYELAYKFPRLIQLAKRYGFNLKKFDIAKDYSPGTMFWARASAFKEFIQDDWYDSFFKKEKGAINHAFEHSVERIWPYIALAGGWNFKRTFNNTFTVPKIKSKKRLAIFAKGGEQDAAGIKSDKEYLNALGALASKTVLAECGSENNILTFKKALNDVGFEKLKNYDQLILADNSCRAPLFPLQNLFAQMQGQNKDFWAATIYPPSSGQEEFLQAHFMVFEKPILQSPLFKEFWTRPFIAERDITDFFKKTFHTTHAFRNTKIPRTFCKTNATALSTGRLSFCFWAVL